MIDQFKYTLEFCNCRFITVASEDFADPEYGAKRDTKRANDPT